MNGPYSPGSEMEKAVEIKTALRLLFSTVPEHVWVYALRGFLDESTVFMMAHRSSVEQVVREHASFSLKLREIRDDINMTNPGSTPEVHGYLFHHAPSLHYPPR